jgi:hypothetical protein
VKEQLIGKLIVFILLQDIFPELERQYCEKDKKSVKTINYHHHHHSLESPTWALAFLRSFCQLKYPAIASLDFVRRVF